MTGGPVDEAFRELLRRLDGGDTSIVLANEIEGLVLDSYGETDWAGELVYVLALYQPGGRRPYTDEADLRRALIPARAALGLG